MNKNISIEYMNISLILFTIGIMFSVAYPEMAQSINDSIYPTISGLIETLKNMAIDSLKRELLG